METQQSSIEERRHDTKNVIMPHLRKFKEEVKSGEAQSFPFPFPIVRCGVYKLRGGGCVMITNVNAEESMAVGVKVADEPYGDGFWMWHIDGPLDWATAAWGMPSKTEHTLDIVAILSMPLKPVPWWKRAARLIGLFRDEASQ